jgi:hypothetical protein
MWSHYGDQHKVVCIGYSVPDVLASIVAAELASWRINQLSAAPLKTLATA